MKIIVKYQIIDSNNLNYGMFNENGVMIPNKRITDRQVPLGGTASNLGWLNQDVHRFTNEIKETYPDADTIEYQLTECHYDNWLKI